MEILLANLRNVGLRLQQFWSGLNLNQKVIGGGAVLFVLIALLLLLAGGQGHQTMEVLYADLAAKDAAAIVEKLDEEKVAYKLEDNGSTILVPSDLKYSTRLKLASENLPQGQAGLELFRETSFGETQTDKKVKYQEALQGELARTIQALDKVKAANVMLALPEESLFTENEEPVKASVVIRTENDQTLTPREVQGIVNLVSNSVERLTPENVVIVDQYGTLVSDNLPSKEGDVTSVVQTQMAMKRSFEKEKEQAIQTMLDKTLGADNSVVRVNADLIFDSKEQKDERYFHDENGPFIRSEEIAKESGTTTGAGEQGVPGTDANIPQYQQDTAADGTTTYDKSDIARNYEINKTETVTKFSPGEVDYEGLTVSILVDRTSPQQESLGDTEEDRVEKIRSIVATACGLKEKDDGSGNLEDQISVAFIDFYTEPQPEPQPAGLSETLLSSPLTPALIAVLALIIIGLTVGLMRRRKTTDGSQKMSEFEAVVEEEIRLEDLIDKNLTPEERERQRIKQEIDRLIDSSPEDAAQVVRAWLAEDSR